MDILLLDPRLFEEQFQDSNLYSNKSTSKRMLPLKFTEPLLVGTCMLLASKFYEPDENLTMIAEI